MLKINSRFQEQQGFVPLSPDFVVELRSKSDTMKTLRRNIPPT
jgi:Uma2 family endonuclease